jgi:hypothetical protein
MPTGVSSSPLSLPKQIMTPSSFLGIAWLLLVAYAYGGTVNHSLQLAGLSVRCLLFAIAWILFD